VALAGLAAPALDVEREPPRLVPALARLGRASEQVADLREDPGVGGGVAARRPADRALVDLDHLVDVLDPGDAGVRPGLRLGAVELLREAAVQDRVHERGLAGPRRAGDAGQGPEGDGDVQVLEVVLARPDHRDALAVAGAALLGHLDLQLAPQVRGGERPGVLHQLVGRAGRDDRTSVHAGTG